MFVTHKIALRSNQAQSLYFSKACGIARFSYNWALAEWKRQYEVSLENPELPKPTAVSLDKELNSIKRGKFPWLKEVSSTIPQSSIADLGKAFQNFFAKRAKYPKFKQKGVRDSFRLSNQAFKISGRYLYVSRLGWVRMCEELRFQGKLLNATISKTANRWFVSITVETELVPITPETTEAIGVDLGLKTFATLSNGEKIEAPKAYKKRLVALKRAQRAISRKRKGSRNYLKNKSRLSKIHAKIANVRKDFLHRLTTKLARTYETVVIEDLNVKGMTKNRHLAQSLQDASFGEFRRQLEYKIKRTNGSLIIADRFFASSKLCSCCGFKNQGLSLADRDWICESCGIHHDRDVNAARNLKNLAGKASVNACGEGSSGLVLGLNETIFGEARSV